MANQARDTRSHPTADARHSRVDPFAHDFGSLPPSKAWIEADLARTDFAEDHTLHPTQLQLLGHLLQLGQLGLQGFAFLGRTAIKLAGGWRSSAARASS